MMGFEWWFAALALLAAVFVAWPLLAGRNRPGEQGEGANEFEERVAFNDAIYAEQLQDLDQQLERAEISQAQYGKLKKELDSLHQQDNAIDAITSTRSKHRLRHGSWVVIGLAVLLPLVAFLLYDSRSAAEDWEIQQLNNTLVRQQQRGSDPERLEALNRELFAKLEKRLEEAPDNLNNRFLLARTAVELGDFRLALESYRYILEREPESPQVLGEMAQVLFLAAGNRFTPEVQQIFDRALQMDPENSDLLGFAGIGAYQSGKYKLAIDYWQRGMKRLNPSDPRYQTWQRAIGEAQRQLGDSGAGEAGEDGADAQGAGSSLQVSVRLGEQVDAEPGDTVYIYARAWEGAKMPLAMQQVSVADLPITLELDESMSMMPNMTMSQFPELEVVARISSSGIADAQSGDWQATVGPVEAAAAQETVELIIDSQIP